MRVETPRGAFHVGGIAKGAGMIEPLMATMLGFVTTDADITPALLHRVLASVVDRTFNAITVDGECSTNDTVLALASGASGVTIGNGEGEDALVAGLEAVCRELALMIVRGGEGATKLVAVRVTGAASAAAAKQAARTVANSPLVKTAVHGGDPNWGRLVAATGRSGVPFDLAHARVRIGPAVLFRDGQPFDGEAPRAAEYLRGNGHRHRHRPWHRRRPRGDGVDLRSQRRVRAHQRGVPHMSPSAPAALRAVPSPEPAPAELRPQLPVGARLHRGGTAGCARACRACEAGTRAGVVRAHCEGADGATRGAAVRQAVAADPRDLRGRRARAGRRCADAPAGGRARRARAGGRRRAQSGAVGARGRHPHLCAAHA